MSTEAALPLVGPAPPTRVRQLPVEEWERLRELPILNEMGLPAPKSTMVLVLEKEDPPHEIVGYWFLFHALHVEPLWVHPDYQHRVGVIRRMWNGIRDMLASIGARVAYGVIPDESIITVAQQARRIGFQKVPGALYYINLVETAREETPGAGN